MKTITTVGLILAVLIMGTVKAGAHAFLERADPRVGSTVRTSPSMVRLWFSEQLEPAFSSVRVVNDAGKQVDKGDGRVDPATPVLLQVSVPALQPGTYKVIWRVLSVDSHVTKGDFSFRVAP
ncbi:MAG TPA: copper resistance CopC family protein [Candidatus Methylomirabilis sp.]|nr:copper resistance CopC family protein [Candidatus Methylomirabilis sp.]